MNTSKIIKWLKLEGLAVLALSIILFAHLSGNWVLFAVLILSPDLAMMGYAINKSVGASIYNIFHTYSLPAILLALSVLLGTPLLTSISLIWFAHIGMDRMLGYGLKLPTSFKDTHLAYVDVGHKTQHSA